jgi:uncharacterized protein YbbK (DUF523 family)
VSVRGDAATEVRTPSDAVPGAVGARSEGAFDPARARGAREPAPTGDPRLPVLVSACLLGCECRYDGRENKDRALERELAARGWRAVAFCPEEHGGLGTPRPPASIEAGGDALLVLAGRARVVTDGGRDVSAEFVRGAEGALQVCREQGITRAFLKERSPSCGVAATHVAGEPVPGPGVTAALLARHGVAVEGVEGRRE